MRRPRASDVARAASSLAALVALLGGCGGGATEGADSALAIGEERAKPGGGTYFVDSNKGGSAPSVRLLEILWGRLVDVHDIDATGQPSVQPVFRDFIINENVQTDGVNYVLETNPITQKTQLVILRQKATNGASFTSLLKQAADGLPPVAPKNDDGTATEPFSFVARNACLQLRFDDCLQDGSVALDELTESVKVLVGYPPSTPYSARLVFDPNHGDVTNGVFHTTRILIDMTVSETEAVSLPASQPINSLGLPASLTTTGQSNVSVRIPTEIDFGAGQFTLLTNVSGAALSPTQNGPVDSGSPSVDVVRAMRSGNVTDLNNGFLLDLNAPEILGTWPFAVETVQPDPSGEPGFDFLLNIRFATVCSAGPEVEDILSIGGRFLEVTQPAGAPDGAGFVADVRARALAEDPIGSSEITGSGLFLSTYDPFATVPVGCWLSFVPQPVVVPTTGVSTLAQVRARFTEPMDPSSVSALDTFLLIRGDSATQPISSNTVIGEVRASPNLNDFSFTPVLPFANGPGLSGAYHIRFKGVTDLAGNSLLNELPIVNFTLDPLAETEVNGGVAMRFSTPDELDPAGALDLRGQFFYDIERGVIRPRPVSTSGVPVDRSNPVPSIMIPFPRPIQTPLVPLGSKMQIVWRYADLGWTVRDETKYNVDVIGLSWSPFGGQVASDFYEEFEILLSHSRRLPDEAINASFLVPKHVGSGLLDAPAPFSRNILNDPLAPQKTVHPRSLGYLVNPSDVFVGVTGRSLMPFPFNRAGAPIVTYTWRNTAALAKAGAGGAGIPLDIEVGSPLFLETPPPGNLAPPGQVPTLGLPLLMEFRCYPSTSGVGLNGFDINLAVNSSAKPAFRAFSQGGLNTMGLPVTKNPDLELVPSGGFNPGSMPPGKTTFHETDNSLYLGQLEIVIRVSRVHAVWVDTFFLAPEYSQPVLEPRLDTNPSGTQVLIDYRGALGFAPEAGGAPFDAVQLDPYGDVGIDQVEFHGDGTWTADIRDISGARYFQTRVSFINNIETGLNAELSAIGIAFRNP